VSHTTFELSLPEARKIILHAQGFTRAKPFGSGAASVSNLVNHLGYVQLDTISVVERAHHHIIWSRIPVYKQTWLHDAQMRREIFEYWAHAAAFLPMKDYRFSIPVMNLFRDKKDRWPKSAASDLKLVLKRIEEEGPLMSRHFESDHKGNNWWDWKPAKWALQRLFLEGHLMVSHREGFQRVYDLPERILPQGIDTTMPTHEEYYRHMISSTLGAHGLAAREEIMHLRQNDSGKFRTVLNQMLEEGIISHLRLALGKKDYFTLPDYLNVKLRLPERMSILSPFDNLIIWRKRLKEIFDFDYTLECYIPAPKRKYGYFCLPVLYKDKFIGRVDLKADRSNQTLQIKEEFWSYKKMYMDKRDLYKKSLEAFAAFNQCISIKKVKKDGLV
jgi:uncharacterized protein YcaQ